MFSPSFECSRAGLHSAVRLRAVVAGHPGPERVADSYMWGVREDADPELLRAQIEVVISDIEFLSSGHY
jgi:hypothetical protein